MPHEKEVQALRGAFSAIFTPFDSQNRVNLEMLTQIVEYQLQAGLRGFFVTGSTGEGLLLSDKERIDVVSHVATLCGDRGTVIAHVGHPSTDVAARLAKESQRVGADWIASVGPIYYGTTFEGAMRHYRQIAAATDLPFMIYSLNNEIVPERDLKFFDIPNVAGMKYTAPNHFSVQQLKRLLNRPVAMINGFDEQLVAALSFGFQGGIGTTYNFAPHIYARICELYWQGEIHAAADLQEKINRVTHLILQYENRSYHKAVMKYIGFDCGSYRPPYEPLTDQQYNEFCTKLDALQVLHRDQAHQRSRP